MPGALRHYTNELGGGSESDLPTRGRHGTERDYETSAYEGTYCAYAYGGKEPVKSAYLNATGTRYQPSARGRTRSPPSPNGDYDDPSPCVALHELNV